jgi:hypothetical protein
LLAKLLVSGFQNPNLMVLSASTLHIYFLIQCLFYLFFDCLQDRCPRGWVVVLYKITSTTGVGVSVAKAHHPWTVVVGP